MRLSFVLVCSSLLVLSGCSTLNVTKEPTVTQTDEEAARVSVGYWDGRWEYVSADWEAGRRNALAQCRDWGYSKVEASDQINEVCTKSYQDSSGEEVCTERDISRDYQCVE